MNISIWKKTLGLIFIILTSPIIASEAPSATDVDSIPQEVIDKQRDEWEGQLQLTLNQFNRVDLNLQDLALVVNNDNIAATKNKRALIEEIKNLRALLDMMIKFAISHTDPVSNTKLIQVLADVVEHLDKSLKEGFSTLEPYDVNSRLNEIFARPVDIEKLNVEGDQAGLEKSIESFEYSSKNLGLSWYNKAYRAFDDAVIQPSIKHNLVARGAKVLGVSFLAWYALWFRSDRGTRPENQPPFPPAENKNQINTPEMVARLQQEANSDRVPHTSYNWEYWLRDKVGAYPHINNVGLDFTDPLHFHYKGKNPMGLLGNLEYKVWQFAHGQMAIGALAAPLIAPLLKTEADAAYEWASKKVFAAHNRMKGGVYAQKAHADSTRLEPKLTFDDLVGLDYAKDQLRGILQYMENPEAWERGRDTMKIERGYLLTGPTRTGKSYIAEALAGEIRKIFIKQNRNPEEFGFYVINAALIKQMSIGGILELAKREAPCVLFIDEIDLLKLQRMTDSDLLAEFLTNLSGTLSSTDTRKQVFILAATNKPENMDGALKQRGRFGKEIRFEYPSFKERKEFFDKKLNDLAINTEDLNIDKLVYETAGSSYEDLNALIRAAFQRAKIETRALDQELLEAALDSEIRCIRTEKSKDVPLEQRQIISAHQAGHVLATMLLPTGHKVAKVTILPVQNKLREELQWDKVGAKEEEKQVPIQHGKMFTYSKQDTLNIYTKQDKLNVCKIHLAGHIAEEVLLGECGYSYHASECEKGHSDPERAMPFAMSLVSGGVRIDEKTSKAVRARYEDEAFKLIETCKKEVKELFEANKETLHILAQQLQQKFTLSASEIEAIVNKKASVASAPTPSVAIEAPAVKTVAQPLVDAAVVEKDLGIKEHVA